MASKADSLSSRERMLLAMTNRQPDRVPVAPDVSNMIPARRTGKPFWQVYIHNDPPLWRAYIDTVRAFGFDGWFIYGCLTYRVAHALDVRCETIETTPSYVIQQHIIETPAGRLRRLVRYDVGNPPTTLEYPVKDLERDLEAFRYLWQPPLDYSAEPLHEMRQEFGEDGILGVSVNVPGFQLWYSFVEGGLEPLSYALADCPQLIEAYRQTCHDCIVRQTELICDARPDFILLGMSGGITLQSPDLARALSLPTIQTVTRIARQAGVPTMLHSCGKERALVEMCAQETDLDCINPLEIPPMGDCDLSEVKRTFGHRLALMGNLHTTDVMLRGTPEQVAEASRAAIDAAGRDGGFILSTGDQCPRDTPDANLRAMIETAKIYGRYDG